MKDNSRLKNSHDEVEFRRKVEKSVPPKTFLFLDPPPRIHIPTRGKNWTIYLRAAFSATLALDIDKAPIGSRVRLRDTHTKPSIPRSDTEERMYKGIGVGRGGATFQICCEEIFDFSRHRQRELFFSFAATRAGGEIWRKTRKARRMRRNDGLGRRRLRL